MCSSRIRSSCSISDTPRVTVKRHDIDMESWWTPVCVHKYRNKNRNRNKFINQIKAPGGHIQLTIMIDTQQQ